MYIYIRQVSSWITNECYLILQRIFSTRCTMIQFYQIVKVVHFIVVSVRRKFLAKFSPETDTLKLCIEILAKCCIVIRTVIYRSHYHPSNAAYEMCQHARMTQTSYNEPFLGQNFFSLSIKQDFIIIIINNLIIIILISNQIIIIIQ